MRSHPNEVFIGSKQLLIFRVKGNVRLTRQAGQEDYAVWEANRVIAEGGRALMEFVFKKKSDKGQPAKSRPRKHG